MANMYEILSDNLIKLRKSKDLTQAEFAEIIKYSDKSVSKWETGMSIPNIETLVEIADYYGMTVDDLLRKPIDQENVELVEKVKKSNRLVICLLSIAVCWFIETCIFVFKLVVKTDPRAWMQFIWALPVSALLLSIFSLIWKKKYIYVSLSLLLWLIITALFLEFHYNYSYLIFIIGVPVQVIIILLRGLRKDVVEDSVKRLTNMKNKINSKKKNKDNN